MLENTSLITVGLESILPGDRFKLIRDIVGIGQGSVIEVIEQVPGENSYVCNVNGERSNWTINETVFDQAIFLR